MIDQLRQYQRMLSIAESGLFYGKDVYDIERFQELKEIALTLLSEKVDQEISVLQLYLDKQDGYPTPKVDVGL